MPFTNDAYKHVEQREIFFNGSGTGWTSSEFDFVCNQIFFDTVVPLSSSHVPVTMLVNNYFASQFLTCSGSLLHLPFTSTLVGKLNYLTITKLDITFAVSVVSQSLNSPRDSHWDVVTRIFRYIKKCSGTRIII